MEEWGAERRDGEGGGGGGGEVGWRRDVGQEQQGLTPKRTSVHHKHREACLLVLHHSETLRTLLFRRRIGSFGKY